MACSANSNRSTERLTVDPSQLRCDQEMPALHLEGGASLTRKQADALCLCVWDKLGNWDRSLAAMFLAGREREVSAVHRRAFPGRFDGFVKECR